MNTLDLQGNIHNCRNKVGKSTNFFLNIELKGNTISAEITLKKLISQGNIKFLKIKFENLFIIFENFGLVRKYCNCRNKIGKSV